MGAVGFRCIGRKDEIAARAARHRGRACQVGVDPWIPGTVDDERRDQGETPAQFADGWILLPDHEARAAQQRERDGDRVWRQGHRTTSHQHLDELGWRQGLDGRHPSC